MVTTMAHNLTVGGHWAALADNGSATVWPAADPAVEQVAHGPIYSPGESAAISIFLGLIILVSAGGNLLVCVAILTDRRLRKVSNFFLVSLAVADLVVSCLVMPFAVANDVLGYWPFNSRFCNVWLSLDILSATASILNLCAISLDRYVHMKNPFMYEEWMNTRRCLAFIGITWLASLLISFLPIELGWHIDTSAVSGAAANFSEDNTTSTAIMLLATLTIAENVTDAVASQQPHVSLHEDAAGMCSLEINPMYAIVSSAVSFYIPCIVMLGIYGEVYKLARHHAMSIKKTQAFEAAQGGGRSRIQENKALFTLGIIMGLFLVSWFPFFVVNVVHAFCKCVPLEMFQAFTWLGYFNSTQNPIIYSIFNMDFRDAFRKILCCESCRRRDPFLDSGGRGGSGRMSRGISSAKSVTSSLGEHLCADGNASWRPLSNHHGHKNGSAALPEELIPMTSVSSYNVRSCGDEDINDNKTNGDLWSQNVTSGGHATTAT